MNRLSFFFAGLFFVWVGHVSAQAVSVQLEAGVGRLVRHSDQFLFPSDEWTHSLDLSARWQTSEKQAWARYHNYPEIGVHIRYHTFGNRSILGHSLSTYPSIGLPVLKKSIAGQLDLFLGSGVARVSRPYHWENNPLNTAIGSTWNNISRIKIQYSRVYRGWRWGVFSDFTHVSNGRTSTPNTGLNSTELGILLSPAIRNPAGSAGLTEEFRIRKWSVELCGVFAGTSQSRYPGPKFPVYVAKIALTHAITPVQRLHLGLEWERNMERAHFFRGMLGIESREEALQYATSYLLYLGDEFVFGPVSLGVTAGIYLQTERETFPIYNQLFLRYYFLQNEFHSGTFLAVYLKSHVATAQYLGVGIGYQL